MLSSSKEMAEVQKVLVELLGLPNESYQSLTIHMKVGDCIRVEAEFIAKGKTKPDYETTTLDGSDHGRLSKLKD